MTEKKGFPEEYKRNRKLTMKEEKFVRTLVSTGSPGVAVREAYDVTTDRSAGTLQTTVLKRPAVQRRIEEILSERYPDHENDYAALLRMQVQKALSGELSAKDTNELIRLINDTMGYKAPNRTETKTVRATLKLPGT